jgi:hypothetical protein
VAIAVSDKEQEHKELTDEVVFFMPGFHSDAVWLEDQRDYAVSLLGDVRQNLEICRADPHYGVYLHELTYLKPYFDTYVWERDQIRRLIWEGRVGTGGSYNQPTEKLIGTGGSFTNASWATSQPFTLRGTYSGTARNCRRYW